MKTTTITIITAIILVVIGAVYFLSKGSSITNPTNQSATNPPSQQTQGIQNDSDLTSASNDMDNTDVNSVDSELNQNDTDVSIF